MALSSSAAVRIGGLMLVGFLAACGGNTDKAPPLDGFSAEEIYKRGAYELETGNPRRPQLALDYLKGVQRMYPYSEWSRKALILEAFAEHGAKNYEDSRASAQLFLENYPSDEDAPYAQYLIALSYYDQIDEVGRDQGLTFKAMQALRDVIEKYPNSDYARSAMLKFDLAFDHLAAKEMEIGRYYLKRGDYAAAINRFRVVVEQYQTTTQTPEALERLVEAYLALGLTDQAQTAGAILGHNFQSSPFYQDAYDQLKHRGLAPEAKPGSWLSEVWRQTIKGDWR